MLISLTCLVLRSSAAAAQTGHASFLKVIGMQELEKNPYLDQTPGDFTIIQNKYEFLSCELRVQCKFLGLNL
jgi:hypothetical protein